MWQKFELIHFISKHTVDIISFSIPTMSEEELRSYVICFTDNR